MKYLKLFENESQFDSFKNNDEFITPHVSYCIDTNSVKYIITKTEEGEYKVILASKKDISGLTYNAIDLGLPSGRLWADRNVGATSPEEYGTYFAWGETEGFTYEGVKNITAEQLCSLLQPMIGNEMELTPDNIDEVLSMMGVEGTDLTTTGVVLTSEKAFNLDCSDYFDTTDGGNTFNKYASDKLTVLEASDDAASVNMGSDWRMPTWSEIQELIDNTTHIFIDLQGNEFSQEETNNGAIADYNVKGVRLTGSNGNSIFIPAAGEAGDSIVIYANFTGMVWASDLLFVDNDTVTGFISSVAGGFAAGCEADGGFVYAAYAGRCYGLSVRGVK